MKKDEGATYPAQAITDKVKDPVTVDLILELDATGAVTKVTVEKPVGHGFDEAALEAAKKLEYEPATPQRPAHRARRSVTSISSIRRPRAWSVASRPSAPARTPRSRAPSSPSPARTARRSAPPRPRTARSASTTCPPARYRITVAAGGYVEQAYDESLDPARRRRSTSGSPARWRVLPPSAKGEEVDEVQVRGTRPPREVTKRTLEQRELSRIPGTNGDALRAIQNLPGVARPPAIAGLLIVRGASPNETNIYVDGTLVPIVYHFGGLSSVIPTEMLEKIDFYPGNFSTYYGRVTGAIVDVGVRDPKKDKKLHGLAQVDLIDARVLAEGPLFDTGWNFAVAGRRSYVDLWLKPVLEQAGAGVTTAPVYYDYQAMLQKDFDKKNSLRLFFFGSDDRLSILTKTVNGSNPGIGGNISIGTAFYRFQVALPRQVQRGHRAPPHRGGRQGRARLLDRRQLLRPLVVPDQPARRALAEARAGGPQQLRSRHRSTRRTRSTSACRRLRGRGNRRLGRSAASRRSS